MDIIFYCVRSGEQWSPEYGGGGGAEQAVRAVAIGLADVGLNVTVYSGDLQYSSTTHKVLWKPIRNWENPICGALVLWRFPSLLKEERRLRCQNLFLDLHEAIPRNLLSEDVVNRLNGIFFKSHFHRGLYPQIPSSKCTVIPNPIDASFLLKSFPRDQYLVLNTAFPARSLVALLSAFREIKLEVPKAQLAWAYGWNAFDRFYGGNSQMENKKSNLKAEMKELEVIELGSVDERSLDQWYLTANVYAYPSRAAEVDCISISKAQIAGAIPIATTFGALGEKRSCGGVFLPISRNPEQAWDAREDNDDSLPPGPLLESWKAALIQELKSPRNEAQRASMRRLAALQFSRDSVIGKWLDHLKSGNQ